MMDHFGTYVYHRLNLFSADLVHIELRFLAVELHRGSLGFQAGDCLQNGGDVR